jgi:hypothetical protein
LPLCACPESAAGIYLAEMEFLIRRFADNLESILEYSKVNKNNDVLTDICFAIIYLKRIKKLYQDRFGVIPCYAYRSAN